MPDGSDVNNRFYIIISYVPAHWLNLDMEAGSNIEFIAQNLRSNPIENFVRVIIYPKQFGRL